MSVTEAIRQAALAFDGPYILRAGAYQSLAAELGSNHAADHWLRGLATALGKPVGLPDGGYIAPRGWDEDRLRAYLCGRASRRPPASTLLVGVMRQDCNPSLNR